MRSIYQEFGFPVQRVPNSRKKEADWYAACCDWVIAQGMASKDPALWQKYDILNGKIPDSFYRKILNPYNATQECYKRFPATMRNYDLMKGIIRRYVSEYIKNPHDFIVGANNAEVVLARNSKLRQALQAIVQQKIAARIQQSYQEWVSGGNDPKQFNPQNAVDVESFVKEFNDNYIDDISAQGQALLNVIKDLTNDQLLYAHAYFYFVTFGCTYTYTDIVSDKIVKRVVSPIDAYPIITDNIFREDDDMFAERRKMTYQQIVDEFDEYLDENQRKFLNTYYAKRSANAAPLELTYRDYEYYFPDVCKKYSNEDRELLRRQPNLMRDTNPDLYDVWHVVWRGEARRAIVTYVNQIGMLDTRVEDDEYEFNPAAGDVSIEYVYEPQVYECVRIGTRNDAIYPYGARAIAYNRRGKLPYNGIDELLPGFGKFSIVDIVTPYQVFYNIVSYHREMTLAKNKLNMLLLAKSLLGKVPEETIYRMLADGLLLIDDSTDQGMLRAQQVRVLQSNIGEYLTQLGNLLEEIKDSANEQVDMTPQRYGEIANSAGKAVTEEAVVRGSMGTVIIEFMMDSMRERDYNRDLDYSKLAWIDGLDTSYRDTDGSLKYISLDIDSHVYADYIIKAKNSVKEQNKLNQLQNYAFSAAQNGDNMMAIAAIEGDNVATISKLVKKYQEEKNAHEEQLKQLDQQTAQMEQEFEIQKIQVKGEEDRKTKELEGYLNQQIELIRADANMISYNAEVGDENKEAGLNRLEAARSRVEQEKIAAEKQKTILDTFNKERDRQVKMYDIDTKLKIAKENKNKYDSKPRKSTKK